MYKNKQQGEAHGGRNRRGACDSPRNPSKKHEEGEEVGERGVGSVPGVFCFCEADCQRLQEARSDGREVWGVACVSAGGQYEMGKTEEG